MVISGNQNTQHSPQQLGLTVQFPNGTRVQTLDDLYTHVNGQVPDTAAIGAARRPALTARIAQNFGMNVSAPAAAVNQSADSAVTTPQSRHFDALVAARTAAARIAREELDAARARARARASLNDDGS